MGSTILIRTLMDRRYFHGIRTTAAIGLTKLAVPAIKYIGLYHLDKAFSELYCFPDNTTMPRPNDFLDRASYLVQCTIPRAMTAVRDQEGRVPIQVRKFLFDKIKFNDNTHNENNGNISDSFYLATLMDCLFEAVASMAKPANSYSFAFDEDEQPAQTEDDLFRTEALNELERYRNSDEWTPSYQNITTTTAIACLERLIASGLGKDRAPDILAYTRPENAENVRLRAFEALSNLKLTKRAPIIRYLLNTLSQDPSPHVRDQLLRVLGQALGSVAIGDDQDTKGSADTAMDIDSGLVLEQEAPSDNRALEIARKSSPEGALIALKQQLDNDEIFKEALWTATLSPVLSLQEMNSLLDIAALLFEPSSMQGRLILTLPLPHHWQAKHVGQGKLRFARSSTVRTRPSKYYPLSHKDAKLVNENDLKYSGPIAQAPKEPKLPKEPAPPKEPSSAKIQPQAPDPVQTEQERLAAMIAQTKRELERQQQQGQRTQKINTTVSQMSPPPVPTPTEGGGGGLKLSLKRKQSVDAGRAASPKAPKTTKGQTANGSVPGTPSAAPKATPAPKFKPSKPSGTIVLNTTPKSAQPPKPKSQSRLVKLRFPTKASRARSILNTPSKSSLLSKKSRTPTSASATNDSYFPPVSASSTPPTNGILAAAAAPQPPQNWNAGGFRSFSAGSDAAAVPKVEEDEGTTNGKADAPLSSPDDMPLAMAAQQRNGGSTTGSKAGSTAASRVGSESRKGSEKPEVPKVNPPSRKITLKLGPKKLGGAGSP